MKKITILSILLILSGLGFFYLYSRSKARESYFQNRKTFDEQNKNYVRWFNNGEIDSLVSVYAPNACIYNQDEPPICGKGEIYQRYQIATESYLFKVVDIKTISLNFADTIAIEKSMTTYKLIVGELVKSLTLKELHYTNGKWLIVNSVDVTIK